MSRTPVRPTHLVSVAVIAGAVTLGGMTPAGAEVMPTITECSFSPDALIVTPANDSMNKATTTFTSQGGGEQFSVVIEETVTFVGADPFTMDIPTIYQPGVRTFDYTWDQSEYLERVVQNYYATDEASARTGDPLCTLTVTWVNEPTDPEEPLEETPDGGDTDSGDTDSGTSDTESEVGDGDDPTPARPAAPVAELAQTGAQPAATAVIAPLATLLLAVGTVFLVLTRRSRASAPAG